MRSFVYNAYNATLNSVAAGNTNPLAGQPAFTGTRRRRGRRHLGPIDHRPHGHRAAKDKIQLRFDIGTDGCGGTFGWYVDDLQVVQCR